MNRRLVAACFLATLASACADGDREPGQTPSATPTPVFALPTLQPAAPPAGTPYAEIVSRLRANLGTRVGVAAADIRVVSLTAVIWPDGCLGLGGPGMVCTQALVPGWLAILRVPDGQEFRYRGAGDRFAPEP